MVLRISDTERDNAVDRLQQAYADGRLSSGEMEQRLELVLTATSQADLEPALADLPEEVVHLASRGGRTRRAGEWRVPRFLRIDSEYGGVWLDMTRAVIDHPQIDIELHLPYGSATIVLPAGASANADGMQTEWGGVTSTVPGRSRPGRPHIRVTGEMDYGRLRIRYARMFMGSRR
ncbi:DUF1707 SHOCT-like domain-containing protein [Nonomuraea sp. 3N208]|uniref:DUF1707 SHOCT-like domain-containing protein n=1 Tax=Nonomuraea sp. 3N208 TaxID=3457421 RepID=UPI003FD1C4D1